MTHSPPDSDAPRSHHALALAAVLVIGLAGCQEVRVAGRAPTAPTLYPVSSTTYSVSLGTGERLDEITKPDQEPLNAPRTSSVTP